MVPLQTKHFPAPKSVHIEGILYIHNNFWSPNHSREVLTVADEERALNSRKEKWILKPNVREDTLALVWCILYVHAMERKYRCFFGGRYETKSDS